MIVESVAPVVEQSDQDTKDRKSLVDEFAEAVAQKLSGRMRSGKGNAPRNKPYHKPRPQVIHQPVYPQSIYMPSPFFGPRPRPSPRPFFEQYQPPQYRPRYQPPQYQPPSQPMYHAHVVQPKPRSLHIDNSEYNARKNAGVCEFCCSAHHASVQCQDRARFEPSCQAMVHRFTQYFQ